MPLLRLFFGVIGVLMLVPVVQAQSLDVIPPPANAYEALVTDRGDMLSGSEAERLRRKLKGYADTTSTQIVIVTLPRLDGVPVADYAIALGRAWGVGQQGQDNGVVILLSRDDRKMFIATGYGLEGAITDAMASRIVRNIMTPAFRQGRFYSGLSDAVDALIDAARGEYQATPERVRSPERGRRSVNSTTLFIIVILIYFFLSGLRNKGGGGRGGRRYRRHGGMPPFIIFGGGGFGSGGGSGGFGGGGFGGFGGGSFGGGGAGGGW